MVLKNRILKEQLLNNTVSHAYLFVSSSENILEEETKAFIYDLLGLELGEKFLSGNYVDFLEVLPDNKNIKIAEIRNVIKFLSTSPVEGKYKLVLIRNAEFFRKESANALLKILEEPPEYGKIILTTNNEEQIIKTIISRCQVVNLENNVQLYGGKNNQLNDILINSINRELLELARSKDYFNENKDDSYDIYTYFYNFFHDLLIYKNTKDIEEIIYKDNINIYKDIDVFNNENILKILDKILEIKNNFKINVNFQLSNEELLLYIMEEQNGRSSRNTLQKGR
ncbi:ATP-binding protein [Miniphocaeibacter halophilus]|uniref:Uncharacterized protein n=1 Tax=Miniphocaeibacter halophilus TaxID=2931922 RepID=A0AC61MP94_9FIRM|nr:hypothetical protein [Miniphocaeibacter halophilus]QQK07329.1 hypothetical protein JFY71_08380 [Miniphocaeibacter halophilus]